MRLVRSLKNRISHPCLAVGVRREARGERRVEGRRLRAHFAQEAEDFEADVAAGVREALRDGLRFFCVPFWGASVLRSRTFPGFASLSDLKTERETT